MNGGILDKRDEACRMMEFILHTCLNADSNSLGRQDQGRAFARRAGGPGRADFTLHEAGRGRNPAPAPRRQRAQVRALSTERDLLEKLRGCTKVFLDERGREWTSEEFAEWLGQETLRGTRELVFLVGGPDGFSAAFRKEADLLMALSRMTLTRDWARSLLLEQIYRGFTILRGFPYAR